MRTREFSNRGYMQIKESEKAKQKRGKGLSGAPDRQITA
jgi:hypothetical protein